MTEPTYTYIKGQGWVPIVGVIHGQPGKTQYRLEVRAPMPNERFTYCSIDNATYVTDGAGDLVKWDRWCKNNCINYGDFILRTTDYDDYYINNTRRSFVTAVPV